MLKKSNNAIGVFDSGLGGLTVLKSFLKVLPDYSYIYLGDIARLPYGSKSQERIYQYTCQSLDFLFKKNCQLVIVACNSASAQALRKVQQEYLPKKWPNKKVLGVVRPLVENAILNNYKKIGILGTKATINSKTYSKEILKLDNNLQVFEQAAPLLVPLIEENWIKKSVANKILKSYLRPLKQKQINYLILACTHYPFLFKKIKHIMGKNCLVEDPGKIIANSLKDYLKRHIELKIEKQKNPRLDFFLTDQINLFKNLGEKFLEQKIDNIKKIDL
jgi:glutamate racemase